MGQGAERCRNEAEATLPYRYLSRTSSAQILNRRSGHKLARWTRSRSEACGLHTRGPPLLLPQGFVGDEHATWGAQLEAVSDESTVVV